MQATVISVVQNVTKPKNGGGTYSCTEFTYQPDPYKGQPKDPVTRGVFTNAPCHADILALKAGDRVELTFVRNGRFQNLDAVTKIAGSAPAPAASSGSGGGGWSGGGRRDDPETTQRIARAVALKAAVDFVGVMVTNGVYTKTSAKPDNLENEVDRLARDFEGYLTLNDDMADMVADFDQPAFD